MIIDNVKNNFDKIAKREKRKNFCQLQREYIEPEQLYSCKLTLWLIHIFIFHHRVFACSDFQNIKHVKFICNFSCITDKNPIKTPVNLQTNIKIIEGLKLIISCDTYDPN